MLTIHRVFVLLEGHANVTFPTSDEVLHVPSLKLYIATDIPETSELGHITVISAGSRFLQFPYKDGLVPAHTAVPGECGTSKVALLRDEL